VQAAGLAPALGTRLAQAGSGDDRRSSHPAADELELSALARRALVDVTGDDQLGSCVDQRAKQRVSLGDRPLQCAPGSTEQVVVEGDHAQRRFRGVRENAAHVLELSAADGAALLLPGSYGVQAADDKPFGPVDRLELGPAAVKLLEGPREAPGRPAGDVVVTGDDEKRGVQRAQEGGRPLVLGLRIPVREVTARDDELRPALGHEHAEIAFHLGFFLRSCMKVGDLQDA